MPIALETLGWFDGNPTNISRLSPREEARRFVDLAGGYDALLAKAKRACADEDHQWALELCDRLLTLQPEDPQSISIRINSMRALAEIEINPTARNTYLLTAKRLETAGE